MATVKKGTFTAPPSIAGWRKHLRRYKRAFWKCERAKAREATEKVKKNEQ